MKRLICCFFFVPVLLCGAANSYPEFGAFVQREELGNPYADLEPFIAEARKSSQLLPIEVLERLKNFKENKMEKGYLLFRNLPTDFNLAKTPGLDTSFPPEKDSFVSEFCLSTFSSVLGEAFNYIQEENGNIFRNVRPTKKNASEQTSDGSKVDLELHTETAFHPFKPDYLILCCLRGDRSQKAYTLASSLKDIIPELDPETLIELRKNQFRTGIDVSFGNKDKAKYGKELIPALYGEGNDEMVTYDLDLMEGMNDRARFALTRLKEAALKVQEGILLTPGDVLILDNRRVIHGRTAFDAYFDGYDRWLQRVYVSTDANFIESIPVSGRVIKQEF